MIPVVFKSYSDKRSPRLHGDQVMLDHIFTSNKEFSYDIEADGAIVCFNAVENHENVDKLNDDLAGYKWVLLIVTANEDGSDVWERVKHPNIQIWVQTPGEDTKADRYLPLGYPSVITGHAMQKKYDWFFSGQVNHQRREDCVAILKELPNGKLNCTEGFNQGYNYGEYMNYMAEARFIPCPAGPATVDSFRVYEALESGSIPILDNKDTTYWRKVLGEHPLPKVDNWHEMQTVIDFQLVSYDYNHKMVMDWWGAWKAGLANSIVQTVKELRSRA